MVNLEPTTCQRNPAAMKATGRAGRLAVADEILGGGDSPQTL